ncbi:hypothetical protein [Flavobacterium sp.]|uniref:rolling circle replication-associated protein n=1 Tax=Flavobacterium sp. TaxID=239 RepID=UPI0026262DEB|nr:hypothetical protein [Flavobacterium sp.]
MGRNKKIKTIEEEVKYKERRKHQNRTNQRNYRLRKKLENELNKTPSYIKNDLYKTSLKHFLKEQEYNYFITLTTREILTKRHINKLTERFINRLKSVVDVERVFYVIEKKDRPHIHILLKTSTNYSDLTKSVDLLWDEGFVYSVKIYSKTDDYTLENYIIKEVYYNSREINWWIL